MVREINITCAYVLEVALGIPKKKSYPRATLVRKFILVQESEIFYPSLN